MPEIKRSVCPFDCPDSCGLLVTVENGKIRKVAGDSEHPRTNGYVCRKMQHYEEMVNSKERILYPLRRTGKKGEGLFERITWEDALAEIADRWKAVIADFGAEAILPYSYAGVMGSVQRNCGEAFFHYMGASRLVRTICSSGKGAGWEAVMGSSNGLNSAKLADCDLVLIWGSNVLATRLHDLLFIKQAKQKGARIVLIETYETPTAPVCTDVRLVRPGSDGALALAMIHVMEKEGLLDLEFIGNQVYGFHQLKEELESYSPAWAAEKTGLSEEEIRELAIWYGSARCPGILLGSGPSRYGNGAMGTRCICALPAVTGAWEKGGGISGCNVSGPWLNSASVKRPDFDKKGTRKINMNQLAAALNSEELDPPVKSLYVYAANPVNVTFDQKNIIRGLQREDLFTVVHERILTDTARYADIILPATYSVEHPDIYTPYGYNGIQYYEKSVDPAGECRSNWNTFRSLSEAMGFTDSYFERTEEEICRLMLEERAGQTADLSEEEFRQLLSCRAIVKDVPKRNGYGTVSGKIELYRENLEHPLIGWVPPYGDDDICDTDGDVVYPLRLVAAPSAYTLNSTFNDVEKMTEQRGKMKLLMHPEDAAFRKLADGELAVCRNDIGEAAFYIHITDKVKKGSVIAEGVYTMSQAPGGFTANALMSERLSDMGEATTMNDNVVEVHKIR